MTDKVHGRVKGRLVPLKSGTVGVVSRCHFTEVLLIRLLHA